MIKAVTNNTILDFVMISRYWKFETINCVSTTNHQIKRKKEKKKKRKEKEEA
jgi:hypothetical protein